MGDGRPSAVGLVSALAAMVMAAGAGFGGGASTIGGGGGALPQLAMISTATRMRLPRLTIAPLETCELVFVRARELVAEQPAEAAVRVLEDFIDLLPVQFPIARLSRHGDQAALAGLLAIELLLEMIGVELGEHRFEGRAHS